MIKKKISKKFTKKTGIKTVYEASNEENSLTLATKVGKNFKKLIKN